MTWERNRPQTHIPAAVKREVRDRAGDWCEARIPGVCRGDDRLQYDHRDGVSESGGPAVVDNSAENIELCCHPCHNVHTQQQADRARNGWRLQPERHPGLRW